MKHNFVFYGSRLVSSNVCIKLTAFFPRPKLIMVQTLTPLTFCVIAVCFPSDRRNETNMMCKINFAVNEIIFMVCRNCTRCYFTVCPTSKRKNWVRSIYTACHTHIHPLKRLHFAVGVMTEKKHHWAKQTAVSLIVTHATYCMTAPPHIATGKLLLQNCRSRCIQLLLKSCFSRQISSNNRDIFLNVCFKCLNVSLMLNEHILTLALGHVDSMYHL